MAVSRAKKKEFIEDVHGKLSSASTVIVAHYKGLSVAEMTDLRMRVRKVGAGFKVTKNKLAQRALDNTKFSTLTAMFKGPTAITYSQDPVAAAKVLVAYAKENEKLIVMGGAYGDRALDLKGVEALSKLPSLDELRAKIIGMIQTPATRIAGILQAPAGQVARVVGAYARKG